MDSSASTDKLGRATSWWSFAGTLLYIAGALNIAYGIAAGLAAVGALLTVGLAPVWTLCMFIVAIVVLYELAKSLDNA